MTIGGASTAVSGILTEVRVGASPKGEGLLVLTLEPNIAGLARGSGFSVHQGMSAPDLVAEFVASAGVPIEDRTSVPYRVLEFQARYGESLLTFASRLLEGEGIHYHFEGDTTVLADTNTDFPPAGPALTYAGDGGPGTLGRFGLGRALVPTRATVRGFNFLTPDQLIQGSAGGPGDSETYVFSSAVTSLNAAQRDANRRLEGATAEGRRHAGASGLPTPRAGSVITVVDTLGGAFNGSYLVTAARHVGISDARGGCFSFGNEFSAIPSAIPFRPPRVTPVPNVGGPVSAVVTGPAGSTVHTDQHGRVKLSFRFDRDSQNDENSSAWVRVGVPAGHTGEPFVPLVGSEALVAFIEGDPSQPIVIGSLNNPEDPPPSPTP
jgi:type VI secretion system secreted protein VgrG